MKNKLLVFIALFIFSFSAYSADSTIYVNDFNHTKHLQVLKNSKEKVYNEILAKYDEYLLANPDDIYVQIEKCNFIQYAFYDESAEYNPNQEVFDSVSAVLVKKYPNHPEVIIFQLEWMWGDEKKKLLDKSIELIEANNDEWNDTQIGTIYYEFAVYYNGESKYEEAFDYMEKAISYDKKYESKLMWVRILMELKKDILALKYLRQSSDTSSELYQINQKADLFLKLKDYNNALKLYEVIKTRDSSYVNNEELANTFVGIGKYKLARKCLVTDTSNIWGRESSYLRLYKHDLEYSNAELCLQSYNAFRSLGYSNDPLGIYRLRLFFTHPSLSWKLYDMLGILSLLGVFLGLVIVPAIWLLPVYFIGHKWKIVHKSNPETFVWGLKSFWWVSTGYFTATVLSILVYPEYYEYTGYFKSPSYGEAGTVMPQNLNAISNVIFILTLAFFSFTSLYRVNFSKILPAEWNSFGNTCLGVLGIFFVFKVISAIYIGLGITLFDIDVTEIAFGNYVFLSTRQEVLDIATSFGAFVTFLLIAILVPFYEEIIFRGVIIYSLERYITPMWANIFQASLFAAVHDNLFLSPHFFIFGMLASFLNKKFGSILPGIVLHILNNSTAMLLLLLKQ